MKAKLRKELLKLAVAEQAGELGRSAEKRLQNLRAMQAAEDLENSKIVNMTNRELGSETQFGIIAECPCGERGARRELKMARDWVVFTHTARFAPTMMRGGTQLRVEEAHHVIKGKLLEKDEKPEAKKVDFDAPAPVQSLKARTRKREVAVSFGFNSRRVVMVQNIPCGVVIDLNARKPRKASVVSASVPEWRRAAAQKAWETIRAKRAAQALATAA